MAPNAEANRPPASVNQELLQDGASIQQECEVLFLHDEGKETELPEVGERDGTRKGGSLWEPPEADVEFGEGRDEPARVDSRTFDERRGITRLVDGDDVHSPTIAFQAAP